MLLPTGPLVNHVAWDRSLPYWLSFLVGKVSVGPDGI